MIEAFARNDRTAYFAAFAPEASFIFHGTNRVLASRADYQAEWQSWIDQQDFRVQSCVSSNRVVKLYGDTAVLTHQTITCASTRDGPFTLHERETIVLRLVNQCWLGVHEHLSLLPG